MTVSGHLTYLGHRLWRAGGRTTLPQGERRAVAEARKQTGLLANPHCRRLFLASRPAALQVLDDEIRLAQSEEDPGEVDRRGMVDGYLVLDEGEHLLRLVALGGHHEATAVASQWWGWMRC